MGLLEGSADGEVEGVGLGALDGPLGAAVLLGSDEGALEGLDEEPLLGLLLGADVGEVLGMSL